MKTWVGDGPKTFTGLAVFGAVGKSIVCLVTPPDQILNAVEMPSVGLVDIQTAAL